MNDNSKSRVAAERREINSTHLFVFFVGEREKHRWGGIDLGRTGGVAEVPSTGSFSVRDSRLRSFDRKYIKFSCVRPGANPSSIRSIR